MPSCIYCGAEADSAEHWLPRSLGTFGPLQVLHGVVCGVCNEAVGEADREFVRTGPEGIHRRGLGIAGREGQGGNPFYYRAATTQPVQARSIADPEDPHLYWETRPGENGPEGQLMQQLVLESDTGEKRAVPFNLEWSAEVLRRALETRGVQGWALCEVYFEPEHMQQARSLLSQVLPGFSAQHFGLSGAGQSVRTIGFMNEVGPSYFRGICKIAFHGALRLFPDLDGHAWEFDSVRRFIRYDERPISSPVAKLPGALLPKIGDATLPGGRGHIFIFETRANQLFVRIQFFVSRTLPAEHVPPPWQIRLGRKPTIAPDISGIWLARYLVQPDVSGHIGDLIRLQ